jgi:hypothetical protein
VHAQSPNRVGLVVRFGDGSSITRCVEFSEPQISGYDVLMRSGLSVVAAYFSGEGTAICAIEDIGCPVESCLTCATPNYWSYWHLVNGAWIYSQVGASGYNVHNGDVEGWSWGAGNPPPVVPFDQICIPPATDTPTPLPPTATPLPTATPPPPTATPLPTDTSLPSIATLPPPTPVVWFRLDENPIPASACTTVRWDTSNASEVYLDGERVDPIGSREVCPTVPQEYHLRTVSAAGEQTYTLVLGVTGASSAPTHTPGPTGTTAPAFTPGPTAAVTVTPTLTPTPRPTGTPAPATPVATVNRPATPSPRPVAQVSTPTSTSRQPTTQPPIQPNSTGYVIFGAIAAGLLAWLVLSLLRRR